MSGTTMAPDIEPIDTQALATLVANMIQAYLADTPPPFRSQEVCHDNASNPGPSAEDGVCLRASIDDGAGTEPSGEYRAAICPEGQGDLAGMAGNEHANPGRGSGNLGGHQQRPRRLQEVGGRGLAGRSGRRIRLGGLALARSNADWHRLIEICALTGTLIIDEDGCYNPADFNDGLLLGMKAQMSQAELHFLRLRLQGGKLNKAKKGELRFPLPVGLCYDDANAIVLDPDAEVRGAVEHVVGYVSRNGHAYAVAHVFAARGLKFPKRAYGGVWNGQLIWGHLTDRRVLSVLKNPAYAGVYAFGRYRCVKHVLANGEVRSRVKAMPRPSWLVEIQNHHPGYISFDEHLHNLDMLERNRTNERIRS